MSVTNALEAGDGSIDGGGAMAEVRADGTTTRYRRAGSGRPVLLLCDTTDSRFAPLFDALARRYRVIAPLHCRSDDEERTMVDCLAAFIEGLGLGELPVVAAGSTAGPAAALSRLHEHRVRRVVLLGLDVGEPEHHVAAALEALARED